MEEKLNKRPVSAYILAILGVIYTIIPTDIIPDIPIVGWVDDFFILTGTLLNLLEKELKGVNLSLSQIVKTAKWILIGLGIIIILLILILGVSIFQSFSN